MTSYNNGPLTPSRINQGYHLLAQIDLVQVHFARVYCQCELASLRTTRTKNSHKLAPWKSSIHLYISHSILLKSCANLHPNLHPNLARRRKRHQFGRNSAFHFTRTNHIEEIACLVTMICRDLKTAITHINIRLLI